MTIMLLNHLLKYCPLLVGSKFYYVKIFHFSHSSRLSQRQLTITNFPFLRPDLVRVCIDLLVVLRTQQPCAKGYQNRNTARPSSAWAAYNIAIRRYQDINPLLILDPHIIGVSQNENHLYTPPFTLFLPCQKTQNYQVIRLSQHQLNLMDTL